MYLKLINIRSTVTLCYKIFLIAELKKLRASFYFIPEFCPTERINIELTNYPQN